MRIAQVAPLYESVPPKFYGGTERVVSYLTEGLCARGHNVTLFASGDSVTSANLIPWGKKSLRLDPTIIEPSAAHAALMDMVLEMQDDFDLIHFHSDFMQYPVSRAIDVPKLSTLHCRLDQPEVHSLLARFGDFPLVSISLAQRKPLPENHWIGNVYHGLPVSLYKPVTHPKNYLAFLGRVSPEKGLLDAIEIAMDLNMHLKIAAKIDPKDEIFFEKQIKPRLKSPLIEYIGEIGEDEKNEFLGNAKALLFPINWPEPFGMVMIESMACGTPVIALNSGSAAEVIKNGVSGIVANSIEEAVKRAEEVFQLNRATVREEFEKRFSLLSMVENYEDIYDSLVYRSPDRESFNYEPTVQH